jgi:hypothetical protein
MLHKDGGMEAKGATLDEDKGRGGEVLHRHPGVEEACFTTAEGGPVPASAQVQTMRWTATLKTLSAKIKGGEAGPEPDGGGGGSKSRYMRDSTTPPVP